MKIVVEEKDIMRQIFRTGWKGGQHQNKTESGVRLTHLPTGIIAESRCERSQSRNERLATQLLLSKIVRYHEEQAEFAARVKHDAKPETAFSSQVRSYVLHGAKQRVVDHRTGHSDTPYHVLTGGIDGFIDAYMRNNI